MKTKQRVSVRLATGRDLETVVALRVALLREYPEHPIYGRLRANPEQLARPLFAAQLDSGSEAMFLAEIDGAAVGILRCVETVSSPLLAPDRYCYVSSAYVKPAHRRQGILRALMAHASDWCRERGLTEMRLHNVGTQKSAVSAWDAVGFEVVEQVRLRKVAPRARAAKSTSASTSSSLRL